MRNIFVMAMLLACVMGWGQNYKLPEPKSVEFTSGEIPQAFKSKKYQHLIHQVGIELSENRNAALIKINFSKKIKNPEAYQLKLNKNEVNIEAATERGVYYALLRLKEIINAKANKALQIYDFPDVEFRGVVEGFYGTPWQYKDRLRMLSFLGKNRMNTYIYGPKDDPYHSSPHWREAYPEDEARQIQDYVEAAKNNYVDFYWAIHPGKDIKWNEADRQNLIQKFEKMYALGVRGFAVFFDDISGEGTNAAKQAELLNFIQTKFVDTHTDVLPLIMCPTEYNKSWSNLKGGYLPTLGKELDPRIHIMWTGDGVIGDVTKESLTWINDKINRKAFFWWNFPVTDYARDHLMLGPAYRLDQKAQNLLAGVVSNPMEHAEASRIAIASVGDYTWDIAKYDSIQSWEKNITNEFETCAEAYTFFAKNNTDAGPNGHRYRKEESRGFEQPAQEFSKALKNLNLQKSQIEKIQNYYKQLLSSAETLQKCKDNPALILEIYPWILQTKNIAQKGLATLEMYDAYKAKNQEEFLKAFEKAERWELKRSFVNQDENKNPYHPRVSPVSKLVSPLIDDTFKFLIEAYNQDFKGKLVVKDYDNPHQFVSNNAKLKDLNIRLENNKLAADPVLEVIEVRPNDYFTFEFKSSKNVKQVLINTGEQEVFEKWGQVELLSENGEWKNVNGEMKGNEWIAKPNEKAQQVRFKNKSKQVKNIYLRQLEVTIK
ncbi:O-GlcNAcase BT_4395 precursor [Candidatus Ornithobacterium hominis]|uniref:O-GlcNAcase BT_4395 n=1 Tax=Candidatus Ornithobacterium hominis TaxID=2497989 RepID=A0A383TVX0_9FLAO|nr:beta-N-acetylglucosaminidase domain-containing protein [Candidatus Ornithobacterium hominis]MCT7903635.1 beta-N-acetylglucosaminidase domain-containing protein [Candidatus Ornithobacterium hominis]SZD70973.1 O-GlcNAcase BT_4395 precursor [Candidatus Ornithobacterium hominis]